MKKKVRFLVLAATMLLVLTGCGLKSPDELYQLPRPTPQYESLQGSLDALLKSGYEYAAPLSGSNTQSVQLQDLDGDGVDEAVAFFRESGAKEHPLKICIFHGDAERGYELAGKIESDGDAINSVVYCQLNDTPTMELVVGWRISGTVYALSAYSLENGNVTQLMSTASYTRYAVNDLDQDNQAEIVSIQMGNVEEGGNVATYYDWSEGTMMEVNSVPLSVSVEALDSVTYGYLSGGYPALYVNGFRRENHIYLICDVLALRDGTLTNITMDPVVGDSDTSHLVQTDIRDINNDMSTEIPIPRPLSSGNNAMDWVQYDLDGNQISTCYTIHNTADGWYFILPDEWIQGLSITREESNTGATVERSMTFSYLNSETGEEVPFLSFYKNTGDNRESRATMGDRFLLTEDVEATYAAEVLADTEHFSLTKEELQERFQLIMNDWSND